MSKWIRSALTVLCIAGAYRPVPLTAAIVSGSDVIAPSNPWKLPMAFGVEAGPTLTWYTSGPFPFRFPNPFLDRAVFERQLGNGSGWGFTVALAGEVEFARRWAVYVKGGYATRHGDFFGRNAVSCTTDGGVTMTSAVVEDTLALDVGVFSVSTGVRHYLIERQLYVMAGASVGMQLERKAYDIQERFVQPTACFYARDTNNAPITAVHSAGTMENPVSTQIEVMVGAGMSVELEPHVYLTPELSFGFPLKSMFEGLSLRTSVLYPTVGVKVER